ncbi:EpsG family protein [Flagellimonas sp. HMM57]|uniref:EpsG family protein n=1 Tax=unclassified Flagellimonas TaxID=2644544 RepID=UPI0013CF624E|nr:MULTISPECIES: EpsG family protein [unclassified Flagellimonas]UII77602.1 EpsG family protein [Flagellimonas sp. HMM57]
MRIDKNLLISGVGLLLSPFLALPGVILGILKKQSSALFLLAVLFGLVEYQIIPKIIDDLARHYDLFEDMSSMSISRFFKYLSTRPDFLFYWIMYIFSKLGFSARFFASTVVFFILSNFFLVFHRLFNKYSSRLFTAGLLMLLLSFQWKLLLMGLRNYWGFSFVLLAFYFYFFEKSKKGHIYLILACFIHFSSILFVPVYIFFGRVKNEDLLCRVLFICSLGFVFIPKEALLVMVTLLPLKGNLQQKALGYLTGLDVIEEAMQESFGAVILYYIKILWTYFAYLYLLFTYKRKSLLRNMVYILVFTMNIFSAAPDIFTRIGYVVRPMMVFLILFELAKGYKNKFYLQLFFLILLLYTSTLVFILKDVLFNSLFDINSLITLMLLVEDAPLSEIY